MKFGLKLFSAGYILSVLLLLFYSFTQVDLSLTLSRVSVWQGIQKFFQHIGYFDRPLSAYLFVGIVSVLFIFYLTILWMVKNKKISEGLVWVLIVLTTVILTFSYNAFSYDLFNYIFDAKIITYYSQNPYDHKALDFPGDPMLSFMHWTHRTYPYGPVWLLFTVPLSFLGFKLLLPTLILFKLLMSASFLLACYAIYRLAKKTVGNELFVLGFFAFNPLVLVESLVSAHNDIVMMALVLMAMVWFLDKKYAGSVVLLGLSVGVKFATGLLLPVFLLLRKNVHMAYGAGLLLMVGAVLVATQRTTFQPWYLLYALPFAALLSKKYFISISAVVLSIAALLQYLPFLYVGNWDTPIPQTLNQIMIGGIVLSIILTGSWFIKTAMLRKWK